MKTLLNIISTAIAIVSVMTIFIVMAWVPLLISIGIAIGTGVLFNFSGWLAIIALGFAFNLVWMEKRSNDIVKD